MDQRSVSLRRTSWLGASFLAGVWLSAFVYVQAQAPVSQSPSPPTQRPQGAGQTGQAGPAGQGPAGQGPGGPQGQQGQGPGGQRQAGQPPRRAPGESPASGRRPPTRTKQVYTAAQITTGRTRFAATCGFCHGRDALGGETGPDLTRSELVALDVRGNKLGPMIRSGRPEKGMPPFTLSDSELIAIVAFIHDAKVNAETLGGGRRSVEPADIATGNADAGKAYFNGPGGCATCHQATGPFATVGARYQGLPLLQRMLYPGSGARLNNPPPAPAVMTIKTSDGKTVTGKLVYRDEFTITVADDDGWTRSWPVAAVSISGEDPLQAHVEQLGKYTDADMHNVYAFLATLR